jgi:LPXTG-motif cell wall-anchored protein
MASSNQGGSILSFLIIGGVLVALLIAGAYFVQQRSTAPHSDKVPVVTQPATQSKDTTDKKQAPATEDKKVAVEPKKDEAKTEAAPKADAPKATPKPATPPAAQLPKTGLAETVSSLLGLGLLSGMIVAYARSRHTAATL